ncbi:MAG: PAS domain S-box protein, partial [Calditrichaeota bacterium]
MKRWVYNTTISQKLWFLSGMALVLVVILFYFIFMRTTRLQFVEALEKKGESVSQLLATNLGAGLYLNDKSYIQKILKGMEGDSDIAFLYVFDKNGNQRYAFQVVNHPLSRDSLLQIGPKPLLTSNFLIIKKPIYFYREFQGYLILGFHDQWVKNKIASQEKQILFGTTIFAVIIILLTLGISNFIVSPIRHAIHRLGQYSYENNQLIRFPESGKDELSQLGITFNKLITQVEDTIQKLRDSENYIATILDLSPIPLIVADGEGIILNASSNIQLLANIPGKELKGKPLTTLLPEGDVEVIYSRISSQGESIDNYITSIDVPTGQKKIVELNISSLGTRDSGKPEFIFALIDITEKIETQREILEHQNRLQKYNRELSQKTKELGIANEKIKSNARKLDHLIQISQEIIRAASIADVLKVLIHQGRTLIDANKAIIFYWNPKQKKLVPSLSYPADYLKKLKSIAPNQSFIYKSFEDNESFLLNEDGINASDCAILALKDTQVISTIALPLSEKDYKFGVVVYIKEDSGVFYIEDLNFITTLVHQAAITLDKIYLLQAFREKARNLEKAYQELKSTQQQILQLQKMESLGTLVGGIAHDFNNILGIIIPNLDLMRMRGKNDPELLKRILIIQDTVERAADLTRQLLMFSRNQDVHLKPIQINNLLSRIARMLKRTLGKHIDIQTELDENLPLIQADETRLTQVIVNLAVNARDAMPDGGVLK